MLFRLSRFLFEVFIRVCFSPKFYGRENVPESPYVVVANHISLLDPPLAGIACKKNDLDFMAKKELFDKPILGTWTRNVNCIRVDRDSNSIQSLKEVIARLKKGRSVGIFPEGTRSEDGDFKEAKRGVGFMIFKGQVPVIPVYIEGSNNALPKKGRMKFGAKINVIVGKPIQYKDFELPEGSTKDKYEFITNMVMDKIKELKEKLPEVIQNAK